ncbi:MAG: 30S ribosomal protein S5 [Nanoarchaeota archaeon]|nr:30S ribosomal protein S5 [Nanoarchaeota archaeon]
MEKSKTPKKKREKTKEEIVKTEIGLEEEVIVEQEIKKDDTPQINVPFGWKPKTNLGKSVVAGKVTNIDEVFENGMKITEHQIVDVLLPTLENEIILIGGSGGKGGGSKRILSRRTVRMHKSGRRFRTSAMVAVGNGNGFVGVGMGSGPTGKHRDVMNKATNKAKMNIIPIRRGCGSWECKCGGTHSIPFAVSGKSGSVHVDLIPAPKGIGLCVSGDVRKLMRLAGIKDIWVKSRGQTGTRYNSIRAFVDALGKLNRFRSREDYDKATGLRVGRVE